METFVGRQTEIARLTSLLDEVSQGGAEPGRAISIRGRRRVGKSRMVAEFLRRADVPAVYFTAAHGGLEWELRRFSDEVARSNLPNRDLFQPGDSWESAFRSLALLLPSDKPSVLVIDEVPYLMRDDKRFEGTLQAVWDRVLSKLPVLLILVGSNRAEMERLTSYDRPFYLRGTEMELGPLQVTDVGAATGLNGAEAIDAYLITGGLPLILSEWKRGQSVGKFLQKAIANPLSAMLVSGERAITAEAPPESNSRVILEAIGTGETTFTTIARTVGLAESTLLRSLDELVNRRLIVVDQPLSTAPSKLTRYRIEDSYLRFWLAFLSDQIPVIEAGRSDVVFANITARWNSWRGKAVEPVIRDLLWRSRGIVPESKTIGSWWNRSNAIEVDIIGADRRSPARKISYLGSIKWREHSPFTMDDAVALISARNQVPGAENAPLVAVSRTGFQIETPDLIQITPNQLITAAYHHRK